MLSSLSTFTKAKLDSSKVVDFFKNYKEACANSGATHLMLSDFLSFLSYHP